mmetsp:Transcript_26895/g.82536  ORF Transcript_26895/g.82536 Transcript_26895/m.82536 type:complete len:242 (+) Transcript_26895:1649-2374(+)
MRPEVALVLEDRRRRRALCEDLQKSLQIARLQVPAIVDVELSKGGVDVAADLRHDAHSSRGSEVLTAQTQKNAADARAKGRRSVQRSSFHHARRVRRRDLPSSALRVAAPRRRRGAVLQRGQRPHGSFRAVPSGQVAARQTDLARFGLHLELRRRLALRKRRLALFVRRLVRGRRQRRLRQARPHVLVVVKHSGGQSQGGADLPLEDFVPRHEGDVAEVERELRERFPPLDAARRHEGEPH